MKKFLNARFHGFADFAVVALFGLGPTLFGMNGIAATLCYALAGVHLALTLTTNFEFGVVKLIPFHVHGYIEFAVAPTLAALPWLFKFNEDRTSFLFFTAFGGVVLLAALFTDYRGGANRAAAAGNGGKRILRTVPRDDDDDRFRRSA